MEEREAGDRFATYEFGFEALVAKTLDETERDLQIHDILKSRQSRTHNINALLAMGFELPDAENPDFMRLSIVDRNVALFMLCGELGSWPGRFSKVCEHCKSLNELRLELSEFDFTPATAHIVTVGGRRFTQPNGYHEHITNPSTLLAALCCDDKPVDATREARIIKALERTSAKFESSIDFACAHCGETDQIWFDPFYWLKAHARNIAVEVHVLALNYGWDEGAILALAPGRRAQYVALCGAL